MMRGSVSQLGKPKSISAIVNIEKTALISRKRSSSKLIRHQMVDNPAQPRLGPWGGKRVRGEQGSNRTLKRGTNRTYILARLVRDRPDLAAQVEAGEMSAHAAAIELGWAKRVRTVSLPRRTAVDVKSLIA
jgi:hypothetical protein